MCLRGRTKTLTRANRTGKDEARLIAGEAVEEWMVDVIINRDAKFTGLGFVRACLFFHARRCGSAQHL